MSAYSAPGAGNIPQVWSLTAAARRAQNLGWSDAIALLESAGVPLLDDTADGGAGGGDAPQFVVIDRQQVLTGSGVNFTSSGIHGDAGQASSRGNMNHLLQLNSPELAQLFAEEFARSGGGPAASPIAALALATSRGRSKRNSAAIEPVCCLPPTAAIPPITASR